MQESGLTEIIPLICTSAVWDQYPTFSHAEFSQGSFLGEWLQSAGCQLADAVFSPEFPQSSYVHLGGLQSLMAMTSFVYWDGRKYCISRTYHLNMRFVAVQLPSCVWLFSTVWTVARHVPLSFNISWSLLKLMSIESVMPSNYRILCHPLLLPSVFPSISIFSNKLDLLIRWPKRWSFSISPSCG